MDKHLNEDAFVSFGDQSTAAVSRVVFQVVDENALVFSAVPKARKRGLPSSKLIEVPYTDRNTGLQVAAGTPITTEGLFEMDATGVEVGLDNNWTSGEGRVYFDGVEG